MHWLARTHTMITARAKNPDGRAATNHELVKYPRANSLTHAFVVQELEGVITLLTAPGGEEMTSDDFDAIVGPKGDAIVDWDFAHDDPELHRERGPKEAQKLESLIQTVRHRDREVFIKPGSRVCPKCMRMHAEKVGGGGGDACGVALVTTMYVPHRAS